MNANQEWVDQFQQQCENLSTDFQGMVQKLKLVPHPTVLETAISSLINQSIGLVRNNQPNAGYGYAMCALVSCDSIEFVDAPNISHERFDMLRVRASYAKINALTHCHPHNYISVRNSVLDLQRYVLSKLDPLDQTLNEAARLKKAIAEKKDLSVEDIESLADLRRKRNFLSMYSHLYELPSVSELLGDRAQVQTILDAIP